MTTRSLSRAIGPEPAHRDDLDRLAALAWWRQGVVTVQIDALRREDADLARRLDAWAIARWGERPWPVREPC